MEGVHTKERQLEQELTGRIEQRVPGTEVLAVELLGPERFCVYIDHPRGVDHALCERVTRELDDYRREYAIDASAAKAAALRSLCRPAGCAPNRPGAGGAEEVPRHRRRCRR